MMLMWILPLLLCSFRRPGPLKRWFDSYFAALADCVASLEAVKVLLESCHPNPLSPLVNHLKCKEEGGIFIPLFMASATYSTSCPYLSEIIDLDGFSKLAIATESSSTSSAPGQQQLQNRQVISGNVSMCTKDSLSIHLVIAPNTGSFKESTSSSQHWRCCLEEVVSNLFRDPKCGQRYACTCVIEL